HEPRGPAARASRIRGTLREDGLGLRAPTRRAAGAHGPRAGLGRVLDGARDQTALRSRVLEQLVLRSGPRDPPADAPGRPHAPWRLRSAAGAGSPSSCPRTTPRKPW